MLGHELRNPLAPTLTAVRGHPGQEDLSLAYPGRALRPAPSGTGGCRADAARLEQVLGNLVSNAMAYGELEAPVTVSSWIDAQSLGISVHNLGPPIPADTIAAFFQPMTRGTKVQGARRSVGLGLYIVSEIVRAHGGRTQVQSTAESGTTFLVVFGREP